ncbi:hypothetical protein DTO006G1_4745 [Penicillium roqueforti]|uniref:uncharacterized protein n=1 Tax=Penicillium roqueforti TaxID=5082 RepID=UPI00190AA4F6|nr:uncharacterized protein LCP9604111_9280 [Penicillium roqueforti]KAF9239048.1 hypothetical protein LCP9604111_9280 [Penicillium roqueforti]KAI1830048.1 hypothetical protein CBS147337_9100 [Penicillium roqueforti]KAI2726633.1 hypothetical protein CBS147354_4348 [Penicillium roqueforti]KAI2760202.1 hypothetical protein DTO006G1_4745 [Penicillium roqueforti]KAI3100432.1 hypothetical protein CBS147333_8438 [Penicillium roqueforti]
MVTNTHKVFRRDGATIRSHIEPRPLHGPSEVLVKVRAVSLNWKDVAVLDGRFPFPALENGISGTEFAGEVVSVGNKVKSFTEGDRVTSLIDLDAITGREKTVQGLGQNIDGTLAEYLVMPAESLVKIPDHLTWPEASMIACAGLTAWSALNMKSSNLCGKTVLIEGTGGVSLIALILAVRAGAYVIITSSSDDKLEKARILGASHTINYAKHRDWENEVLEHTGGLGVDIVVEQGGAATLLKSVSTVKKGGQVSQVGLLTANSEGDFVLLVQQLIIKACRIVGIQVGTKVDLEDFVELLRVTRLGLLPVIDRIFEFEQAPEACAYLQSGKAFGKVVVQF